MQWCGARPHRQWAFAADPFQALVNQPSDFILVLCVSVVKSLRFISEITTALPPATHWSSSSASPRLAATDAATNLPAVALETSATDRLTSPLAAPRFASS